MRKVALAITVISLIATATITAARYVPEPKEDCLPYDVQSLSIVNEGESGWLLTDGSSRMLILDNEEDAQAALALAKRYRQQCFIGRSNRRVNRKDYIVEYWK